MRLARPDETRPYNAHPLGGLRRFDMGGWPNRARVGKILRNIKNLNRRRSKNGFYDPESGLDRMDSVLFVLAILSRIEDRRSGGACLAPSLTTSPMRSNRRPSDQGRYPHRLNELIRHRLRSFVDCYKRQAAFGSEALKKLVSIPANPVPDNFVTGKLKTPDRVSLRFARWLPPAGRKGTVVIFRAAANGSKNISRRCAICVRAALPWRRSIGAARVCRSACSATATRLCARLCRRRQRSRVFMRDIVMPDCPPPAVRPG